ncbi:MAG: PAS domain-containing sensor histidine kinase [Minicystis sp.]
MLVQSIRDYAIFMLDPGGHVRTWNAGAEHIKGYAREEIVGKHFSTFYPPEDIESGKPAMELRVAAAEGRFEDEGWRLRNDGSRFWANVVITAVRDDAGRLVGFAKVTRDLTERRRAEEEVRQSEERFRLLLASVKDYAIYMLDPDGIVTSWNPGAEALKGYRADEIIGKHYALFYPPAELAAGKPARALAIARTEGRYEEEGERVRKDGSRFWASIVITAMRNDAGELVGFAKVTRDLTERRRAEDERLRLAHAQEAVRLRDEFLSIASHELKTPLTALHLQLQRLEGITDLPERATRQLERAARNSTRLIALVETLLDVVRITGGRFRLTRERFDMGEAIRETVYRLVEDATKAGSPIKVHEKGRVVGSWDRLRVEQIFTNLITNAIKYGAGTPIDIRIDAEGEAARITVTDRGPGIAPEDKERIFGRFERAAPMQNYGGLGLGLYITRQIVEAHGGSIAVESEPGAGATFIVRLPLDPPERSD